MHYNDLAVILSVCRFFVFCLWGFLLLLLCVNIFRKNYDELKHTILYSLNTIVFLPVLAYVLSLALIVRPQIKSTREASVDALQASAQDHFSGQLLISFIVVIIIALLNFLYMRFVMKRVSRKIIVRLAVAEILILVTGSVLACMLYIAGLAGEIDHYFDRAGRTARINNVEVLPDSTLRLAMTSDTPASPTAFSPLSHLRDTTFISGNTIIFLRPDAVRFEELMQAEAHGLLEADGDFGWGISQTMADLQSDSVKFNSVRAEIVTARYVALEGCADCPAVIDRDTVNYGVIFTGTGRKNKPAFNAIHSWSYGQEIKEYFGLR
jgi:hypothetical protein